LIGARLPSDQRIQVFPWSLEDECARLARFDVGIMPLDADEWAAGKGGYKLLQYMACGIPSVASSIGAGPSVIRDGETGFIAASPSEWDARLRRLVADARLRQWMGYHARVDVERDYSLERWAPGFIEVLESCATD
jgi:glycosyltransferase involved in cell wall biosynthesis